MTYEYRDVSQIVSHPLTPTGLRNLGNTCYLNCSLQILMSSTIFSKEISNITVMELSKTNFLREFMRIKISGDTKMFHSWLIKIYPDYADMNQQDTNECFLRILDVFEKEFRITTKNLPQPPVLDPSVKPDLVLKRFSLFSWRMNTLTMSNIYKIFYGQIRSLITCSICKQEKNNFIPFNSLSIVNAENIAEGLINYQKTEHINGYECETCKKRTKINKTQIIWKLPKVLILQFPMKDLRNLHESLKIEDHIKKKNFTLRSIGCHSGYSINSGHYYTFVKYKTMEKHSQWFSISDDEIRLVKYRDIVNHCSNVYILCYERVN